MIRKRNYILVIQFEDGASRLAWDAETDFDLDAERVFNTYLDNVKRSVENSPEYYYTVTWYVYGKDEDGYLTEERKRFEYVEKGE